MALIDVVKFEGGDQEFVWKFPSENLRWGTQLVVKTAQVAFFLKGGKILDEVGPGTVTLKSNNIPLLTTLMSLPFGGTTPFQAEVWFVNMISKLNTGWGTFSPIQLEDPKYGVILPVRAFGQFGFKVGVPRQFLTEVVGVAKIFTADKIVDYFRGKIISSVSSLIGKAMARDKISFLEVNAFQEELSRFCEEKIKEEFMRYGLELLNFFFMSINVPEDDASLVKLRQIKEKAALLNVVGRDIYQLDKSMEVLKTAAGNKGNSGAMMGTGMGLGLGFGLGGAFGQQMGGLSSQMRTNLQEGVPPPPPTGGPMTAPQLYLMVGGKQLGPITVAEIRALVTSGEVKGDTLVWKPGEAAWQRADGHPDLQALFRPPPANQEVTPTSIYLFIENQQAGPFSPEQVAGMVSAGKIKGDTLVWKPGFAGWVRADSQADIQKMLGTMGSPPPPPIPSGQS